MKALLLSMLVLLMIVDNALALSIVKPQKGEIYLVGQTLTVELQPLPEEDIEQIIISTDHFDGAAMNNAPFRYDFRLHKPVDGQEMIGIVGVLKNGKTILLTTYIYVKLPADIEVKDILFDESVVIANITPLANSTDTILAYGIFSNGSKYPLNSYSQTKYESVNESIAKVDSNGVVTGVFPGKTSIKVTAGIITKEIKVKVTYKLDPIKGITVAALDKSNEIKWDKSPYEGEVVSGYRIYRSKNSKGLRRTVIGNVSTGVSSFVDTQIEGGVKYYYSVEAFSQKYNTGSSMKNLWILPSAVPPSSN